MSHRRRANALRSRPVLGGLEDRLLLSLLLQAQGTITAAAVGTLGSADKSATIDYEVDDSTTYSPYRNFMKAEPPAASAAQDGIGNIAWYNTSWGYRLPITITNGSSTSALSYAQVAFKLTGSAYTSFHTHAKSDGSDIVVTDSDGVTTLPFALEGIDTTGSAVYLVVEMSLAAQFA